MIETLSTFAHLLGSGGYAFFQILTYSENYDYTSFNYYHTEDIEMHALAQHKVEAIFRGRGCDAIAAFETDRTGPDSLSHYFIFQKR